MACVSRFPTLWSFVWLSRRTLSQPPSDEEETLVVTFTGFKLDAAEGTGSGCMLNCWCTWRCVHSCSHTGTDTYTPTLKQVQRPRCRDRETRTQAQIQTHTYKPTPTTLNLTHTYNPLAHYTSIHPFTKNTHRLIPTYETSTN